MPVEVKQLGITLDGNAGQSSQKSAAASSRGKDEGFAEGKTGVAPPSAEDDFNPYAVSIELHGIIYIYLPPKIENLAKGEGAGSEKPAEKAPAESPAPTKPKEAETPTPAAEPAATAPATPPGPAPNATPGTPPPAPKGPPPAATP